MKTMNPLVVGVGATIFEADASIMVRSGSYRSEEKKRGEIKFHHSSLIDVCEKIGVDQDLGNLVDLHDGRNSETDLGRFGKINMPGDAFGVVESIEDPKDGALCAEPCR